ncbi:MAG TPA: hypothetical protein VHF69_13545, partial [Candidatus Synoicihabitans sp.]|nr:hypothetical protein [Candidatus Synoicihabitans sp.]
MLSLSESLATELKDTGITVTALCQGPTDTDFFDKADMVNYFVAKLDSLDYHSWREHNAPQRSGSG